MAITYAKLTYFFLPVNWRLQEAIAREIQSILLLRHCGQYSRLVHRTPYNAFKGTIDCLADHGATAYDTIGRRALPPEEALATVVAQGALGRRGSDTGQPGPAHPIEGFIRHILMVYK
jgi:hypothetical protein